MAHEVVNEDIARIVAATQPWDRLYGKSVLVTGAAGLIASYIVETLVALNDRSNAGMTILLLIRNQERAVERFAHLLQRTDVQIIVQDVCAELPNNVRADYVIHAAGGASPKLYANNPVGIMAPNVVGTQSLLQKAASWGCAGFLFFSTSEVYGKVPADRVPTRETDFGELDPTEPRSCYAEAKRAGEALCVAWARQNGIPATIVRPFHTYGPGLKLDDGRVFADFIADVVTGRPITLRSDGLSTRAFCYLADAVQGFFTVLFQGTPGVAYNVGNPRCEISIRDLADLLVRTFPEKPLSIQFADRSPDDSYLASPLVRSSPDISRIKQLGWEPTTKLIDGFKRTVRSFS